MDISYSSLQSICESSIVKGDSKKSTPPVETRKDDGKYGYGGYEANYTSPGATLKDARSLVLKVKDQYKLADALTDYSTADKKINWIQDGIVTSDIYTLKGGSTMCMFAAYSKTSFRYGAEIKLTTFKFSESGFSATGDNFILSCAEGVIKNRTWTLGDAQKAFGSMVEMYVTK
jgi:hypothetical protein